MLQSGIVLNAYRITHVRASTGTECYFTRMPHRELWHPRMDWRWRDPPWSRHALRDLDIAFGYLRESERHRRRSVPYSAAVLGALLSYSRPFTERADAALNQTPGERRCLMSLAADLGADLLMHASLLQLRDEIIALSDIVRVPAARVSARRFKFPNPRLASITHCIDLGRFRKLAASMRVACVFFQAENDARAL
jgi:hypothetical protein